MRGVSVVVAVGAAVGVVLRGGGGWLPSFDLGQHRLLLPLLLLEAVAIRPLLGAVPVPPRFRPPGRRLHHPTFVEHRIEMVLFEHGGLPLVGEVGGEEERRDGHDAKEEEPTHANPNPEPDLGAGCARWR